MGFRLTLGMFLSHLFDEPAAAVQGLTHSIKDIVEILYFYFSELSLTACYVILFILAARFLLRKASKIYSYALWGVVYFKLISILKLDFFRRSLIPQPQIDKIYYDLTPDYTAFYSTEAGIVSQVQSELVTPVPIVTPIYTPALIWFVVLCVLLIVSALMYFSAYSKLKNSRMDNINDNVYISDAISTPFVLGIIRPKIYLPKGLYEQHHSYVVTHEKVHIRRGDHIVKLFAFAITCIHWFNPLVWLSFFLLEKDMEMSCDEKVLQILGNEHKKDYAYCILSLAAGRRFVPKAYLSFGDSDTKKRIKNVLNYKKPAVVASVMTIIGIIVIAVGMLADSGVVYVPDADESTNRTFQINFPVYDQRTEYNSDIFDKGFALLMNLPSDWSVAIPEETDIAYPLVGAWNRMGIYDENGTLVGAIGYNIYDTTQTEPMAIYNQIALGNHYQFAVGGEEYHNTVTSDTFVTSTMPVYTSANMAQQLGLGNEEIVNHGVLCRNSELGIYVAVEFDKDAMDDSALNNFAHSVFIGEPVVENPFNLSYIPANGNTERIKTVKQMYVDGKSESEIVVFIKEELIADGLTEENYKTLTALSFHPITIYCMEDAERELFAKDVFKNWKESNQPGGANRVLIYEELANGVFMNYRDGLVRHDRTFAQPPADFVFPEFIHWGETKFIQDEMGYYNVSIPSVDGKYRMSISVSDFTYDNERPFDSEPTVNYVAFFEN